MSNPDLQASTREWMRVGLVLMFLLAAAFPVYRVYEPVQRAAAAEMHAASLAEYGGELYGDNCVSCHGENGGGGRGPAVGSQEFLVSVNDQQIRQLISLGVPGSEMVAYSVDQGGALTSQQISAIAAYLRSLEEDAVSNPNWRAPLTDLDLSGKSLYALACASCHGFDRGGVKDVAPSISPTSFSMEESDDWLRNRISEGKGIMPRFGRMMSSDQIDKIIAFLRGVDSLTPTTTVP